MNVIILQINDKKETEDHVLSMLQSGLSYEQVSKYMGIRVEKIKLWE